MGKQRANNGRRNKSTTGAGVRIAAAVFSLGLGFGLLEAALRAVPQIVPPKVLLHFSPELRHELAAGRFLTRDQVRLVPRDDGGPNLWTLKPHGQKHYDFPDRGVVNLITADDIGFCNAEGRYRDSERFDIVTVGDSFTACHAVHAEQTWPLRLEQYLDATVYNLGTGGIGLYEYVQLLKTYGLPRRPKVVVMNVYEGNDLRDALRYAAAKTGGVTELDEDTQSQDDSAGWKATWPGRHSYAFNFLFALGARVGQLRQRYDDEAGLDFGYKLSFDGEDVPMNPANQDRIEIINGGKLAEGEISTSVFDDALAAFVALAEENDFHAIVVYSPSAHTAYAKYVRLNDPAVAKPVAYLSKAQRDYFAAKSRELGFAFLDLTPYLERAADRYRTDLLYYPTTLHYTALAHDLIAQVIADLLDDLGLLHARSK